MRTLSAMKSGVSFVSFSCFCKHKNVKLIELGIGSFARMKGHMSNEISQHRRSMFMDATGSVRELLNEMCNSGETFLTERAGLLFDSLQKDYVQTLTVGGNADQISPGWQRRLKKDIEAAIVESERMFKDVVNSAGEEKVGDNDDYGREAGDEDEEEEMSEEADEGADKDTGEELDEEMTDGDVEELDGMLYEYAREGADEEADEESDEGSGLL